MSKPLLSLLALAEGGGFAGIGLCSRADVAELVRFTEEDLGEPLDVDALVSLAAGFEAGAAHLRDIARARHG